MVLAGRMSAALRYPLLLLTLAACDTVSLAPADYAALERLYLLRPDHPMLMPNGPIVFSDGTGSYTLVEGQVRLTPRDGLSGLATRRWRFVHSPSNTSVELVTTVEYERYGNYLHTYDAAGRALRVWTLASEGRLLMEDSYCHPVTNVCFDLVPMYLYVASPLPLTPYEP